MARFPELSSWFERTRDASSILVVDLGFLGDSVHLLPACAELKRLYPRARLETLSAPVGCELLALSPCVDRARAFPLGRPSPPWWRHLDVLWRVRRERFDLAISFSGADRAAVVTALSGARHRVVHDNGRHHIYNHWLLPNRVPRIANTLPVFEQRLTLLRALGMSTGTARWELSVAGDPETRQRIARLGNRFIHLSITSNTDLNEWPERAYADLSGLLLRRDPCLTIAVSGSRSPRDQARIDRFFALINNPRIHRLPAGLSLAQLGAILKQSAVHFGPDSGVMHLAWALGTRTVGTFRERPGWTQWIPPGNRHRTLSTPCGCAAGLQEACVQSGSPACLREITPERAALTLMDQLTQRDRESGGGVPG